MNFLVYSSIRPSTRCSSRAGAQGDGDQRLGLAALEHRRAVDPRQDVHLADDRPECLESRPSGRMPARIRSRTTCCSRRCQAELNASRGDRPFGLRIGNQLGDDLLLQAPRRLRRRACLPTVRLACGQRSSRLRLELFDSHGVGRRHRVDAS